MGQAFIEAIGFIAIIIISTYIMWLIMGIIKKRR